MLASAYQYLLGGRGGADEADEADTPAPLEDEEEADLTAEAATWKASSGRTHGPESYVFGDISRGIYTRVFGESPAHDEEAAEEKATQVQRLVRDAVLIYRARGYAGAITMTHTVGYFTETCTARVPAAPADGSSGGLLGGIFSRRAAPASIGGEGSKAGRVFDTLISRLERRAQKWREAEEELAGVEIASRMRFRCDLHEMPIRFF